MGTRCSKKSMSIEKKVSVQRQHLSVQRQHVSVQDNMCSYKDNMCPYKGQHVSEQRQHVSEQRQPVSVQTTCVRTKTTCVRTKTTCVQKIYIFKIFDCNGTECNLKNLKNSTRMNECYEYEFTTHRYKKLSREGIHNRHVTSIIRQNFEPLSTN